jgi:hypothetical protein
MGYAWLRWGWEWKREGRQNIELRLLGACALLLVCYVGVVCTSRLLADPLIPLDERMLSPALLLMMIMLATTISVWWRRTRLVVARVAVAIGLIAWWFASAGATRLEARYALEWGSDFAGQQWRSSEVLAWARVNAAHTPLYTNWPVAVYFHLHRNAHKLPRWVDIKNIAAFGDTVRARHGIVLLFGAPNGEFVPNDSIFNAPALGLVTDLKDGSVLAPTSNDERDSAKEESRPTDAKPRETTPVRH